MLLKMDRQAGLQTWKITLVLLGFGDTPGYGFHSSKRSVCSARRHSVEPRNRLVIDVLLPEVRGIFRCACDRKKTQSDCYSSLENLLKGLPPVGNTGQGNVPAFHGKAACVNGW